MKKELAIVVCLYASTASSSPPEQFRLNGYIPSLVLSGGEGSALMSAWKEHNKLRLTAPQRILANYDIWYSRAPHIIRVHLVPKASSKSGGLGNGQGNTLEGIYFVDDRSYKVLESYGPG